MPSSDPLESGTDTARLGRWPVPQAGTSKTGLAVVFTTKLDGEFHSLRITIVKPLARRPGNAYNQPFMYPSYVNSFAFRFWRFTQNR
jgi:hypothetical protein